MQLANKRSSSDAVISLGSEGPPLDWEAATQMFSLLKLTSRV
jgi:hypothetical protein